MQNVAKTPPTLSVDAGPIDISKLRIELFAPSFARGQGGAEKVAGQLANILVQAGLWFTSFAESQLREPQHIL